MPVETLLARRYLFGKDNPFLVSFLSWICIFGVFLSVVMLIVVQGVMSGFSHDLRSKILKLSSPIVLIPQKKEFLSGDQRPSVSASSSIRSMTPYLETELVLHSLEGSSQGIKIRAIDGPTSQILARLKIHFLEQTGVEQLKSGNDELPGIILGAELAKRLNIIPELAEEVDLIYPFGEVDPTGEMRPKKRRFRVIGTFKSGYYEADNKLALLDLEEARRLIPASEIPTEWEIQISNLLDTDKIAQFLSQELKDNFEVVTWKERNQRLFQSLKLERAVMVSVMILMTTIASFNIFTLVLMIGASKQKEIAVLKAIGLGQKRVERIFLKVGIFLGILGTSLGGLVGLGILAFLKFYPVQVPASYYLDYLPVRIDPLLIGWVIAVVPLLVLLSSWYPAKKSATHAIVEGLKRE